VGRPLLGVKCGCNEAFVVTLVDERRDVALVRGSGGRLGEVERRMLRPVVRGESVRPWVLRAHAERIIWPCGDDGTPLASLPPMTARWLAHYRRRLASRADARNARDWWSVFRTEGAADEGPRVVWADFGRRPRALVLPAGDRSVPLNTCYVVKCRDDTDARTLAAVLNSSIAASWLGVLAEPARNGFRRYLGWTMARLPLPRDWARARRVLAPLVAQYERRDTLDALPPALLADAVRDAYGLRQGDLAPLLAWGAS
jgi:hypothetical protein